MSEAKPLTIDELVALPWRLKFTCWPNCGEVSLTVLDLDDFEMFSHDVHELWGEWKVALRGHLKAYRKCGKSIPIPPRFRWESKEIGENMYELTLTP